MSKRFQPVGGSTEPRGTAESRPTGSWFDRRWLLACSLAVTLVTTLGYSGDAWAVTVTMLPVEGAVILAWLLAGAGYGWPAVRRFEAPPPLKLATAAGLGLGLIGLLSLGLGLAGLLSRFIAWAVVGVGAGVALFWITGALRDPPRVQRLKAWWRAPAGWDVLWIVVTPFLGMAVFGALMPPGLLWQDEPAGYDVVEYHLQVPREWHDAGRITGLRHNVFSYMPMGVEAHYLLAMHLRGGPYTGMYAAQLMHLTWLGVAVWAAAASARSLSDRPWAAPLAGVAMAVVPWLTALAPVAYNEGGLLFYATLALGWAMLARNWREWAVAGAMAGFACGVKLTAVPMVVAGVAASSVIVAVAARLRRAPQWERPNVAGVAVFATTAMLVFSPWLIRNAVWTGNPVFPERMETFGKAHFSEAQVERWRRAHSPRPDQKPAHKRLVAGWKEIVIDWRYGYAFVPLAVVAGVLTRDRRAALIAILVLLQLVVWLALTHLQSRFFVVAIPAAAILIGLPRARLWPPLAACGILIVAFINLIQHIDRFDLYRKSAVGVLGETRLQKFAEVSLGMEPGTLPADQRLILVGEARAFLYSETPSALLRYRTVFDVPPPPGDAAWLDAWTAGETGQILVFPGELARFKATYHAVTVPPQSELDARPHPYVIGK